MQATNTIQEFLEGQEEEEVIKLQVLLLEVVLEAHQAEQELPVKEIVVVTEVMKDLIIGIYAMVAAVVQVLLGAILVQAAVAPVVQAQRHHILVRQ